MKRSFQSVRERREQIVSLLENSPSQTLSVESLAKQLSVSIMTIRRDLTVLDNMGLVQRNHGSATFMQKPNFEGDTHNKHIEKIKYALARKAASYIKENMTLFVNTSSTALQTVDFLTTIPLTVATNNLQMSFKQMHPSSTIILSGGEIHFPKAALVGDLAAESLAHITADVAILGCSGISPDKGISTGDFHESKINRLMLKQAIDLVIVVADYRKIGTVSNFRIAAVQDIDILITDTYGDPEIIKQIESHGVLVIQLDETN